MQRPAPYSPASGPKVSKRSALTDAERAHIRKRRLEGAKIPEIAVEIARSWSVVGRVAKQLDEELGIERAMGPAPKYDPPARDRTCRHCGGDMPAVSPYYAANGRGIYCSRECFLDDVRTGALVTCPECGKERWRPASHIHKLHCSQRCAHAARRPSQVGAHRRNPAVLLGALAKGLYGRTGSTLMYGRYAKVFAEARGKKPGPRVLLTPREDREIYDDYRSGVTQEVLADRYSVTRKQIRGAISRARRGG
jgi:hypothetical protein